MHPGFVMWLLAVSFGASMLGGMLGMASGIFIVPILTTFGGVDIHAAIPASLLSVIACSCGRSSPFGTNRHRTRTTASGAASACTSMRPTPGNRSGTSQSSAPFQ
jgi:uncharacterized membrane protein YfcA